jgi:hypothetical protein
MNLNACAPTDHDGELVLMRYINLFVVCQYKRYSSTGVNRALSR